MIVKPKSIELSVLMPAYNSSRTIRAAVLSTLISMPRNSELLVYIDGSLRDADALRGIRDSRLRVIKGLENVGISNSLNILLAESKGRYLARMDADDICLPWRFGIQLRQIRKSEADFVFMNAILFGPGLKYLPFLPQPPIGLSHQKIEVVMAEKNVLVHPSMLARADSVADLQGYREIEAEDYDLWLRALTRGYKFLRLSSFAILYRIHRGQLSQSPEQKLANLDPNSSINLEIEDFRKYLKIKLDHSKVLGTPEIRDSPKFGTSRLGEWLNPLLTRIASFFIQR